MSLTASLLVSYVYLRSFLRKRGEFSYRDWVMDSGAWSAHNAGATVDFPAYIATCQSLLATDPTLTEIFSLDVINDWEATARNTETMWRNGIPAIPTYHPQEPWEALLEMARTYPKIALGGVVFWPKARKDEWVAQCFARVWPKKIHGLGMAGENLLLSFPFHSADAANWEIAACKWGRWQHTTKEDRVSIRGTKQPLRLDVQWFLKLELRLQHRWMPLFAQFPHDPYSPPQYVTDTLARPEVQRMMTAGSLPPPYLRLAVASGGSPRTRSAFTPLEEAL
jgi:hypothetical protein